MLKNEILEYLSTNKDQWFTNKMIKDSMVLKTTPSSTTSRLFEQGLIDRKVIGKDTFYTYRDPDDEISTIEWIERLRIKEHLKRKTITGKIIQVFFMYPKDSEVSLEQIKSSYTTGKPVEPTQICSNDQFLKDVERLVYKLTNFGLFYFDMDMKLYSIHPLFSNHLISQKIPEDFCLKEELHESWVSSVRKKEHSNEELFEDFFEIYEKKERGKEESLSLWIYNRGNEIIQTAKDALNNSALDSDETLNLLYRISTLQSELNHLSKKIERSFIRKEVEEGGNQLQLEVEKLLVSNKEMEKRIRSLEDQVQQQVKSNISHNGYKFSFAAGK